MITTWATKISMAFLSSLDNLFYGTYINFQESVDKICFRVHISFFKKVLIILKQLSKHANFKLGCSSTSFIHFHTTRQ